MRLQKGKAVLRKKHPRFGFEGVWQLVCGNPGMFGIWLIYGLEKHGKTLFALMLAAYLSTKTSVLYISAEEGLDENMQEAIKRAGLSGMEKNLYYSEYIPLADLEERLKRQRPPRVVFIDNITVYQDELKNGELRRLHRQYKYSTLFIMLAHEERGEPYTATARVCRKLAKIIINVQGLACFFSGRCPGGWLSINEEKAALYHGQPEDKTVIHHPHESEAQTTKKADKSRRKAHGAPAY